MGAIEYSSKSMASRLSISGCSRRAVMVISSKEANGWFIEVLGRSTCYGTGGLA